MFKKKKLFFGRAEKKNWDIKKKNFLGPSAPKIFFFRWGPSAPTEGLVLWLVPPTGTNKKITINKKLYNKNKLKKIKSLISQNLASIEQIWAQICKLTGGVLLWSCLGGGQKKIFLVKNFLLRIQPRGGVGEGSTKIEKKSGRVTGISGFRLPILKF